VAISIKRLPAGFVFPAQPVLASKPPSGTDWVHEIKHDGYRMIVCRDGSTVRLYSRNAYDWTARLAGIAATVGLIKAKSFTLDGEAVVLGPHGLSRFEELSRREAARTAILHAFDLIERDGEDLRNLPFLDRKAALARLLRDAKAGILLNEQIAEDGPNRVRPCLPAWRRGYCFQDG
jgi:bifunctional non-homologous end joining protein LigD